MAPELKSASKGRCEVKPWMVLTRATEYGAMSGVGVEEGVVACIYARMRASLHPESPVSHAFSRSSKSSSSHT